MRKLICTAQSHCEHHVAQPTAMGEHHLCPTRRVQGKTEAHNTLPAGQLRVVQDQKGTQLDSLSWSPRCGALVSSSAWAIGSYEAAESLLRLSMMHLESCLCARPCARCWGQDSRTAGEEGCNYTCDQCVMGSHDGAPT
jgi:hypothetical protein